MFSNCQDDIFIYLQINYSGATDLGYDSKNARHPIFFVMKFFLFQHVLRVIQIFKVYMKAQVPTKPAEWGLLFGFSFVQNSKVSYVTI